MFSDGRRLKVWLRGAASSGALESDACGQRRGLESL